MKNRKVRQMLASSMAVVVGAGLIGTCAYEDSIKAHAQEVNIQKLEETAEQALGDSTVEEDGSLYKDESVYGSQFMKAAVSLIHTPELQ